MMCPRPSDQRGPADDRNVEDDCAAAAETDGRARRRKVWRVGLVVVVALALSVRFTVRDRAFGLGILYYATPYPVISLFSILGAVAWWRRRCRVLATCLLACALACSGLWLKGSFFCRDTAVRPGDLHVMFWNCARGAVGWEALASHIRSCAPDVVGLVEAGGKDVHATWCRLLPGYELTDLDCGLLVATRGTVCGYTHGRYLPHGRCRTVRVQVDETPLTLLLVDIASSPLHSRRVPLGQLGWRASTMADEPLLVMGDFNTPMDSVFFASFRAHLRPAFETHGSGYAATWPVPIPLLAIDQVWANPLVTISRCTHGWTWCSDHRPVHVWVRPRDGALPSALSGTP